MGHRARRATGPGHPQPPTPAPDPNRPLITRPAGHQLTTRRAQHPRHDHTPPSSHIRVDRQPTRPYDGHGWIRHPSGPLPRRAPTRRPGRGPSRYNNPRILTAVRTHHQTAPPKPPHPSSSSQAANTTLAGLEPKLRRSKKSPAQKDLVRAQQRIEKLEAELARTKLALEIAGKAHALLEMFSEGAATDNKSKP